MKINLTFILIWLSFILAAQQNLGTIKVKVEDGCGNVFTKPVTIDLYQKTGNTFNKIASRSIHPATFTNLETNATYEVRMSSSDTGPTDISIKDIHVMRDVILGIQQGNVATTFVGDSNMSFGISTLDMVLMQRYMIQIPGQTYFKWIFIDHTNLNSNISSGDFLNKSQINGINNGFKEITFNGYKHGAVASTIPKYCGPCTIDSSKMTNIHIPDMDVELGKEVEFSLGFNSKINDVGFLFSLKYSDAVITKISPSASSAHNKVDSISTIHFIAYSDMKWATSNYEIAKIKFTPTRSGKLVSFFEFNNNFKNEFIYKEGDCLKPYSSISLTTSPFCPVTWPLDITIPDCTSTYNTGSPIIDPSCINVVTTSYTDVVIGIPCEKIIRSWTALNWFTGEVYKHEQIITIDRGYFIICNDVTVIVNDSAKIYASDLIQNSKVGHIYSFSPNDPNQNFIVLKYASPFYVNVRIYDLTDQIFCNSKITMVNFNCTDPVKVVPQVSVTNDNGIYLVKGEMFDGGNVGHCLGIIGGFQIKLPGTGTFVSQAIFDYNLFKGTNLAVELRYLVGNTWTYHGLVKINFKSDNVLPPFELSCYDDALTKNEVFEISIFSPNFDKIYALQGAIRLKDAVLVNTRKVALSDIKFNEEIRSLRFVWFNPSAQQLSLAETDTLFTMTILPTRSGNVSDVISIAEDILISEALLDDFEQTKINLVFKFLRRPSATKDLRSVDVSLYPNPTSTGDFTIASDGFKKAMISVYNESGEQVYKAEKVAEDGLFQVSLTDQAIGGLYLVKIANDQYYSLKKMMLIK